MHAPAHDGRLRRWTSSLLIGLLLLALLIVARTSRASGATATTLVTANVTSAISLTDNCTNAAGYQFGTVFPGTSNITDTGANVCSFAFGSSNDTAMLRMYQEDQNGSSMVQPITGSTAPVVDRTSSHNLSVSALPSGEAWAGGQSTNVILHKAAGSTSWTTQTVPVTQYWSSIKAFATNAVFAGSTAGKIVFYNGTSWSVLTPTVSITTAVYAMTGTSATNVFFGTNAGQIIHYDGSTWTDVTPTGNVTSINSLGISGAEVFAGGSSGLFYRSNAGAGTTSASWTLGGQPSPTATLYSIAAAPYDTNEVWCSAFNLVYYSNDKGSTWTAESPPIDDVDQSDAITIDPGATSTATATLWAGFMPGGLVKSTNGGTTWSKVNSPSANGVTAVSASSNLIAVAVGSGALAENTIDGSSWTTDSTPSYTSDLFAVGAASGSTAFAVGGDGTILDTTDGATWNPTAGSSGTTAALRGVSVLDANHTFAVGDSATILYTANGGSTWSSQSPPSGVTQGLTAIDALDASTAFAVGRGGVVLRWDGNTWQNVTPSGFTTDLLSVSMYDATHVFAVGANGASIYSADGGNTWTTGTVVASNDAESVVATGPSSATAMANKKAYTTTDGSTWIGRGTAGGNTITTMSGAVDGTLFVGGNFGKMAYSLDNGTTWTALTTSALYVPYAIVAVDSDTAYAVGEDGTVLRIGASVNGPPEWNTVSENWTAGTGMFGVCLQAVNANTTPIWSVDGTGTCAASNTHPWNAIPLSPTKVATAMTPGASGSVSLVWGMRVPSTQAPGAYHAEVVVDAVAPEV